VKSRHELEISREKTKTTVSREQIREEVGTKILTMCASGEREIAVEKRSEWVGKRRSRENKKLRARTTPSRGNDIRNEQNAFQFGGRKVLKKYWKKVIGSKRGPEVTV